MSHMKRLAEQMAELNQELTTAKAEVRRMWPAGPAAIVPTAPGTPVAYDRMSGIDIISDKSFLDQWNAERILDGVIAMPESLDAWRPQALERAARIRFVNAVKRAGGAWTKADRGTEFHHHAEQRALDPDHVAPAEYAAAVDALFTALEQLQLTVVAVERFVVDDERRLAGTFDMMVENVAGDRFILDLKTGRLHPLSLAMQLYAYAVAPHYFTQGAALDGSEDVREAKPECRTDMAYVAEVDIDAGAVKIRFVDLHRCEHLFALRAEILAAREIKTIGQPLNDALTIVNRHFPGTVDVTEHVDADWRTWMRGRMQSIVDAGLGHMLAARWPVGVPTLKSGEPIAVVDGEALAQLCSELEAEGGVEFPPPAPEQRELRTRRTWPTRRPLPDEGTEIDDYELADLHAAVALLDDAARSWVHHIIDDAGKHGRPIRLGGNQGKRTQRRLATNTALVALAPFDDDALVRSVLSIAIGEEVQPGFALGETFGSLTIDEARVAHRIAVAIADDRLTAIWNSTGVTFAGDLSAVIAA